MKKTVVLLAILLLCGAAQAEVPLLTSDELRNDATHIVVGRVQAVYSTTKTSKDWRDSKSVAEIAVLNAEKGVTRGNVVYAHYWNKRWIGKGNPEPHASGHSGVAKGDFVRAHLTQKDGTFQVLLPNGFTKLKAEDVRQTGSTREERPVTSNASAAADSEELAKVQGKWARTVRTEDGTFKVVKEHKGKMTTVAFLDSKNNVLAAKRSEFRLERIGKVRIFTFFNNVITEGPQKGDTDKAPQSYIYRVTGDSFIEVNGLLAGDDNEPLMFTWQREQD